MSGNLKSYSQKHESSLRAFFFSGLVVSPNVYPAFLLKNTSSFQDAMALFRLVALVRMRLANHDVLAATSFCPLASWSRSTRGRVAVPTLTFFF